MRLQRNSDNHDTIVFFVCPRYKRGQEWAGIVSSLFVTRMQSYAFTSQQ